MDEYWAANTYMDKTTGKIHRIYTYRGKKCRAIKLASRLVEHLAGYTLIEKDLRSALVWVSKIESLYEQGGLDINKAQAIVDRELGNEIKAFFVAALTFYGKCFTKCDGRPVKLERNQLQEDLRLQHDFCMSLRHNFAAHSGLDRRERVDVVVVVPAKPKKGRGVPLNLYTELDQPDYLWIRGGVSDFRSLLEGARAVSAEKALKLKKKILVEEIHGKGAEYWLKR